MVYYESITDSDVENHRDVRQQDAKRKHDGGQDLPSTPSDNLWKLIYLATEALSDSFECIGTI